MFMPVFPLLDALQSSRIQQAPARPARGKELAPIAANQARRRHSKPGAPPPVTLSGGHGNKRDDAQSRIDNKQGAVSSKMGHVLNLCPTD
eukprot:11165862-Lingulodinium_polyedra.AAC.1